MSKRKECPENYKVTTEVTESVCEWIDEVMGGKEFYDFAAMLMYKYKKA
ncbi:hypothetical protein LBW83_16485 [Bacillus velezensis]|nr:hypothetical protein [Bacillus velezensis]MCA1233211.1 hypothetical protein [Bacillus velezensis]MCA1311311.1 hypothetical protein [Bacillus velezensis]MCA1330452.1 hypothetical protein [Bacillus velezensis]NMP63554.1 hypothetical protein [Bacillus velezensis]